MKIKISFILFLFLSVLCFSQVIKGSVVTKEEQPLSNVKIYIDGSQVSSVTDTRGIFYISVPNIKQGNIVFQKEGYQDFVYSLQQAMNKTLKVVLEKERLIEEVKLIGYSSKDYEKYISTFLDNFLGISREGVSIENPKEVKFAYDKTERILRAQAKKPLIIVNRKLGYTIEYKLMSFYVDYRNSISQYTGTSFYKPVKASESKNRIYTMNRLNAYYGSVQHFFKSVFNNRVNKEGFILDRVKHMEGQKALALVEKDLQASAYRSEADGKVYFEFPDILMVSYKKYLFDISKREVVRTDSYSTINSYIETRGIRYHITSDGNYSDPDQMLFQKSWAMDKVAKMLPLDYEPEK
ncbi:carboxypeptidase-like protein [Elizabethkingia sp. YR214]|uniref:carboxypeptidase-like regulatory domain-containing protein n=1 Tax=Elizabethkingia sp. YR214 TaxID=2135667 RepID=UPI000D316F3A|nr:carboxypeptidase-like regulatory domain-containing protein [Elizabethkingia sp. YR214]PUB25051.1 carboxypeptidase-like protein [Elizabethkingia sp. YR214]